METRPLCPQPVFIFNIFIGPFASNVSLCASLLVLSFSPPSFYHSSIRLCIYLSRPAVALPHFSSEVCNLLNQLELVSGALLPLSCGPFNLLLREDLASSHDHHLLCLSGWVQEDGNKGGSRTTKPPLNHFPQSRYRKWASKSI